VSGAPGDRPGLTLPSVNSSRAEAAGGSKPAPGFHGAVTEFKRRLIETTLTELGGNRTRAARALGLQRTYLLRLMREFAVQVPAGAAPPRRAGNPQGVAVPPPR
jgi:DNA-binding NtrC family response regulator